MATKQVVERGQAVSRQGAFDAARLHGSPYFGRLKLMGLAFCQNVHEDVEIRENQRLQSPYFSLKCSRCSSTDTSGGRIPLSFFMIGASSVCVSPLTRARKNSEI